ncbi:inovirus Gp2 family protein [Vibrio splendidus]|uniref:hypothetical protein n=1 Tax=Vibrio splendidus TaxID=29497 RepID=UPI003D0D52FD
MADEVEGLVCIPEHPTYTLNRNHPPVRFQKYLGKLAVRLVFWIKERTKICDDDHRDFLSDSKKILIIWRDIPFVG